jgi:hypothetical protein
MRGPRQRRCVHDQRRPAQTRPKRRSQAREIGSACPRRCFRCARLACCTAGAQTRASANGIRGIPE